MLVILKERGDVDEKFCILKVSSDEKNIKIVKHPVFKEGDDYPYQMLTHLIKSASKYKKGTK